MKNFIKYLLALILIFATTVILILPGCNKGLNSTEDNLSPGEDYQYTETTVGETSGITGIEADKETTENKII